MHGYVFYADGGARGQREHNGAGIHGYKWDVAAGSKSIGHATYTTTPMGYSVKGDTAEWLAKSHKGKIPETVCEQRALFDEIATSKVAAVRFYDAPAPFGYGGTNNAAELKATEAIISYALDELDLEEACSFVIRQDSMYVIDGINKNIDKWAANNFIRKDGTEMPNADVWRRVIPLLAKLQETKTIFKIEYVEAHGTDIGNNSADQLATVALYKARERKLTTDPHTVDFSISDNPEYWAGGLEKRHPMLMERFCFMRAGDVAGDVVDYVLSSQGKDVSLNGKRTSSDGYSVVRTARQKEIESIRDRQNSIPREIDYYYQIDVDSSFGHGYRYLNLYGGDILHKKHEYARHLFIGDRPITEELHPPYLASCIFNNADVLSDFLDTYKDQDAKTIKLTDITDTIFNIEEKDVKVKKGEVARKETVYTLKTEIGTGYSKHKAVVGYRDGENEGECKITLRSGVDFPDRSTLKRIESTKPRVYVLTNWLGGAFMYATVIESGDDLGIWCGINSSLRIIGTPEK